MNGISKIWPMKPLRTRSEKRDAGKRTCVLVFDPETRALTRVIIDALKKPKSGNTALVLSTGSRRRCAGAAAAYSGAGRASVLSSHTRA